MIGAAIEADSNATVSDPVRSDAPANKGWRQTPMTDSLCRAGVTS